MLVLVLVVVLEHALLPREEGKFSRDCFVRFVFCDPRSPRFLEHEHDDEDEHESVTSDFGLS